MNKRLMIFIDGSNVYKETKRYFGNDCEVDYIKLIEKLSNNLDLIRTYFYGSKREDQNEKFFESLGYRGIKTVIKTLKKRDGSYIEKGVDVALATDLLTLGFRNAFDISIVVSGDGDLKEVIERVQTLGCVVKVAFFEESMAYELKMVSDENIYMDEMIEEIKYKKKGE